MRWIFYQTIDTFRPAHLYEVLKLRQDVFIIEQNCIYDDLDGIDKKSNHLLLMGEDENLIGYLRIVPAGLKFTEYSLGRIVVNQSFRGMGYGKLIVKEGISRVNQMGKNAIRIEAQAHLDNFYASLGFKIDSDIYSVDDIPHVQMILAA